MVRIHSVKEINRKKLRELFRQRGHSILTPHFTKVVQEILEGKLKEMEVHQCKCGELMILSTTHAETLSKKHKTDDIPCKVCGRREEQILDMSVVRRFEEITDFLNERYVFTTKSASILKPKDVKTLDKMALGLFPTYTHAEMLVGYSDFMNVLVEHFPKRTIKHKAIIDKLFDKAKTKNAQEFDRLYYDLLNWEESHKTELNIFSKQDILSLLLSKQDTSFLEEDLENQKEIDVEMARIQLELSTYKDTVEIKAYLDILANILNIMNGKRISADPFKALRLPPLKRGGKARTIRSLASKLEYLEGKLPFSIANIYSTHLRNAAAHNEYEIRAKEGKIVLTRYSETFTFNEFRTTFGELKDLHFAITSYLADHHVAKLRLEVGNQGMGALLIGYTDFFLEEEKLHPKIPCDARLNIYQYWDFATFEKGQRIFPAFKIRIEESGETLLVDFGKNGAQQYFKKTPELVEWLEQLILTGRLCVTLSTIAPILPKFAKKAILRVPVGKIMDVYILDIDEKTMNVSSELIKEIINFLK